MATWEKFSRIVAEAKASKKLDPVGKEDEDVDNDGDSDESDTYLKKKRAAVGAAIEADKKNKKCSECGKSSCECEDSDEVEEAKKWFDDDGDGIGYEKGEVSGSFTKKKKKVKEQFAGNYQGPLYARHPELVEGRKKDDSYLETDMKKRRENNEKAIGDMKKTKAHKDMVDTVRKQFEEFVPEDREYRREMAKAASRERSAEKKADTEFRSKGGRPRGGKKEGPKLSSTPAPKSEVDNYVTQTLSTLDYMDKLTKKNKNPIGLVTKEETEIEEGMTMKDFKQQRSRQKQKTKREMENKSPLRRAGIHDDKASPERAARHRANVDPDYDHDDEEDMYPGGKLKNPKKVRKAKAIGELGEGYIEEKSLSRAQQRFMGMVYAAKKGKTPASSEVAKAASGISKKEAKKFASTKHEGLPEKKENTKEELTLVNKMILEFSPLEESKLDDLLADIRGGDEDDGAKKPTPKRGRSASKASPKPKTSPTPTKRGVTGAERAERVRGATRVKAAKILQQTEREKIESKKAAREEKRREEQQRKEEKTKEFQKKQEERRKQQQAKTEISKADREENQKKKDKQEVRSAIKKGFGRMTTKTSTSKDTAAHTLGAVSHNVVQPVVGAIGAAAGVISTKMKQRKERKDREKKETRNKQIRSKYGIGDDSTNENYSNWRNDFLIEIDDNSKKNNRKIVDVMPKNKKNDIEMHPKIEEAAPLIPLLAKVAGSAASKATASKVAGSAAQGTIRHKMSKIIGDKVGNLATQTVQDRMERRFRNEPEPDSSGDSFLSRLSKIGTNEGVEIEESKK